MRIQATDLPTIYLARVEPEGKEIARNRVWQVQGEEDRDLGCVVYVSRKSKGKGTTYGWRPANSPANVSLTDKYGAIIRLPGYKEGK